VGHRKDEYVLLVIFESDEIWKSVDGRLADHRARGLPCRMGFRDVGNPIEHSSDLGDELVSQS
jgi:hypothetical protein